MSSDANAARSAAPGVTETPWPKYHQVYLVLRQQIRDGSFATDGTIPSEMELGRLFGVSRITIRKALDRLEREGTIDRRPGRGTFVRPGAGNAHVNASLSGSIENLIAMGLQTQVQVISFDYPPAPPAAAEALGIIPGIPVQRVVRIRSHNGRPFSHLTTFVPEDLGRHYDASDMLKQPLLLLLERSGIRVAAAEQTITARLAEPEIARLLCLEPGEPLLSITRVVQDDAGRSVELISGHYRPDTYEHRMSIDRATRVSRHVWQI